MTDIAVTHSGEWMLFHAEAQTDRGTEFLDAYNADSLFVVDSGRLILRAAEWDRFVAKTQLGSVSLSETRRP